MGNSKPLIVDLDGTLLSSDLLIETGLAFARDKPFNVFMMLRWLQSGKAELKRGLALGTEIDVTTLPYNQRVIALIEAERTRNRPIILATASDRSLADQVANHLRLFDDVIASDEGRNLSAHAKRDVLVRQYGEKGFDYVGNSFDDLIVWRSADKAIVINPSLGLERKARQIGNVAGVFRTSPSTIADWVSALRIHQWLKNLLVLVPLLASHRYTEVPLLIDALLAFVCFSICASSVYILNDLLDLRDDRHHATKRSRPLAAGRISIVVGLSVFPVILSAALALAVYFLPSNFVILLVCYFVLTLAYSIFLKRLIVIDVVALAVLYSLRVIAGSSALAIAPSYWLLAFSMFIFFSLAMIKRYAELFHLRGQGTQYAKGRGYHSNDLPIIASMGITSGYMAVMVLALYINDARVLTLYRNPEIIWIACPMLLAWISRIWMLAHRGAMHEDPVIFAANDRPSLAIGFATLTVFWAAI